MPYQGLFTAKGNRIPPKPNVDKEVEDWGQLIRDFRHVRLTPAKVRKIVEEHQRKEMDKCSGSDSTLKQPDSTPTKNG